MKISVIGCGRWGSFIAWYLDSIGHTVTLYGKPDSKHIKEFISTRTNGLVTLPDSVILSTDIKEAMSAETVIISVPSQSLRSLLSSVKNYITPDKTFVLCMKGLEIETGKRLTEVFAEVAGENIQTAVWIGPGHVQEFLKGIPNCMVIDSSSEETKRRLIEAFRGNLIRFYYGTDLIGNEIGAAAKNVIGIAAGILDGLELSSLKGALMSRGTGEISRLIEAMGGNRLSAYGLCHLGDYEATVFSKYSHNRQFGESFAKGESYTELAEGYYTVQALKKIAETYNVDLPISNAIYSVLFDNASIKDTLTSLFLRSIKREF